MAMCLLWGPPPQQRAKKYNWFEKDPAYDAEPPRSGAGFYASLVDTYLRSLRLESCTLPSIDPGAANTRMSTRRCSGFADLSSPPVPPVGTERIRLEGTPFATRYRAITCERAFPNAASFWWDSLPSAYPLSSITACGVLENRTSAAFTIFFSFALRLLRS